MGGFEAGDITRMIARASRQARLAHITELAEIARSDLRRRRLERRALGLIQRQIAAPVVMLTEHHELWGRKLSVALAAELATRYGSNAESSFC